MLTMVKKTNSRCKNKLHLFFAVFFLFFFVLSISQTVFAEPDAAQNPYLVERLLTKNGRQIDKVIFPGRPPKFFRAPAAKLPEPNPAMGINGLVNVPAFKWSYGCSATSGAMLAGYYDNNGYPNMYAGPENGGVCPMDNDPLNVSWGQTVYPGVTCVECPLSATHLGKDGLAVRGHVDDYWVDYEDPGPDPWIGNWAEHTHADCTADFMKTNQSRYGNVDGSTWFFFWSDGSPIYRADLEEINYGVGTLADYDGGCGLQDFFESRYYTVTTVYNQYIYGYDGNTQGFTYDDFKAEIDAGRTVLIQVEGHTMLGYGYNDTDEADTIYVHDTWNYDDHEMTWGGYYGGYLHMGVTVIELGTPSKGMVLLDKDSYLPSDTVEVTVSDVDLDLDPDNPDITTVEFTSDTEDVFPKTVTLTETGDSTGIFTGSIKLTDKFLGNILGENPTYIPANFGTYWNQITPENAGKWGEVEAVRDDMDWSNLDTIYNYAKDNDLPFKQHCFVWGSQQPGWMAAAMAMGELDHHQMSSFLAKSAKAEPSWLSSLPPDEQREEVEEWIRLFGERYDNPDYVIYIDVVNEPFHELPSYKDALGGDGETGWDWIIWSFQKARQYCPNAKLLINEYNVLEGWLPEPWTMNDYLGIIHLLKDRGLIDGIGNQCHHFQLPNMITVGNNLNILAATGLPIYITELDIDLADDAEQLGKYQTNFPVLWEHPAVGGITLWGYIEGRMWELAENGYLVENDEETERPALTWLKDYTSSPSGILRIANGDTITVTYEDADDGTGPAIVTAAATVSSVDTPTGLTATAGRNYVFLYWNPVESSILTGYNVYRSASLTGEKTQINGDTLVSNARYYDLSLSTNTTYYYWVTAVDIYSVETDYSNVAVATTGISEGDTGEGNNGDDSGGSGGSSIAPLESGCFIATACYGTPMASEVRALSTFRDEYLLSNSFGKLFVEVYYKVSPQIADFISGHPHLKNLVRWLLEPVVKVLSK